jgi:hypothetical protein
MTINEQVTVRPRGYLGRGFSAKWRAEFAARAYVENLPIEGSTKLPIEAPTLRQLAFAYGVAVVSIQRVLNGK